MLRSLIATTVSLALFGCASEPPKVDVKEEQLKEWHVQHQALRNGYETVTPDQHAPVAFVTTREHVVTDTPLPVAVMPPPKPPVAPPPAAVNTEPSVSPTIHALPPTAEPATPPAAPRHAGVDPNKAWEKYCAGGKLTDEEREALGRAMIPAHLRDNCRPSWQGEK